MAISSTDCSNLPRFKSSPPGQVSICPQSLQVLLLAAKGSCDRLGPILRCKSIIAFISEQIISRAVPSVTSYWHRPVYPFAFRPSQRFNNVSFSNGSLAALAPIEPLSLVRVRCPSLGLIFLELSIASNAMSYHSSKLCLEKCVRR